MTPNTPTPERELVQRLRTYGHHEAADTIESLLADKARLEEALRPFASHVGKSGEKVVLSIGKDTWTATLTTDDFKQARAALNRSQNNAG